MMFDIVIYSGILFGPSLIAQVLGVQPAVFSLLMSVVFIIPTALFVSLFLLDRMGRKPVRTIGMIMAAVMLTVPQGLTVHPADLGCVFSRSALEHRRDRQKSACLRRIPRRK